jgi:acyl-coenzyme A thioesterase PaaI-like protein
LALEDGSICAYFETSEAHQSYPERTHGGVISAILDETIGRAFQVFEPGIFGVTTELHVKFRLPVPLGQRLKVLARITKHGSRMFEGTGEIVLDDGTVAAHASAKYLRLVPEQIIPSGLTPEVWHDDPRPHPDVVEA